MGVEYAPSLTDSAPARLSVHRIPLATLRELLDADSARAHWELDPLGVTGRALMAPAGAQVRFPIALGQATALTGTVRLVPLDWRDGTGSAAASVHVIDTAGATCQIWHGLLASAALLGHPEGARIACELPPDTRELILAVDQRTVTDGRSVGRALWVEMALGGPGDAVGPSKAQAVPTSSGPVISVITPVHNPPLEMLRDCVDSVRNQSYPHWELCLVDDGSSDADVISALQGYAAAEPRIHLHRHDRAEGIATATNQGLELATGEYIALLDHDDFLVPDALARVAEKLAAEPDLDMIYSDEDIVSDGRQLLVHIKPGWSPDLMRTQGYTCHLGVYRRQLVLEVGGFRTEFNGSQDVDLILRLIERTDRVGHIPEVLYHWRAHSNSTAAGDAKPYAYVVARQAISDHLGRIGVVGDADLGPTGLYRVVHQLDPDVRATIIVAAPDSGSPTLETAGIPVGQISVTTCGLGDLPTAAEEAIRAGADYLLISLAGFSAITNGWLSRLLGYAAQPGVAAAGPIVLAPNGAILHAGVAMPTGLPLHLLYGSATSMDDLFGFGTSVHNVLALDGAIAISSASYKRLGGIDPARAELALIDLTLRASAQARVVTVPDARLRAATNAVTNDLTRLAELRDRWLHQVGHDRFYNPNYRADRGDFAVVGTPGAVR